MKTIAFIFFLSWLPVANAPAPLAPLSGEQRAEIVRHFRAQADWNVLWGAGFFILPREQEQWFLGVAAGYEQAAAYLEAVYAPKAERSE